MNFVSLFCGAGGFDLGFQRAGFIPLAAFDNDPVCIATYKHNIGPHAYCEDITQQIPNVPCVDVLIGGPPCQGFSVAGKMDPNDKRNELVFSFMRAVELMQPKFFIMENVAHLYESPKWEVIRFKLAQMAWLIGYGTGYWLLDAADYGVPQHRRRTFLVGAHPNVLKHDRFPFKPSPRDRKVSAGEALATIGPDKGPPCSAAIVPCKRPILRGSAYSGMLFNGQGRPIDRLTPSQTIAASLGGNGTPILDESGIWVEDYYRSLKEGYLPVTRAPDCLRRITVKEAQVLQSFPKSYEFKGPQSVQYRQVGNAVPPLLAYAVAQSVIQVMQ